MLKNNISFLMFFLGFIFYMCCYSASEQITEFPNELDTTAETVKHIENIEKLAKAAEIYKSVTIPVEDPNIIYEGIIEIIHTIIESFKEKRCANEFIGAKGIDRIIARNLMTPHDDLKTNILILTKILFEVTPTATKDAIPTHIVDRLLDIFENDDNLARKAHSLDILAQWLPGNPVVQARVMKMKGLEPFYNQISKLDGSVIKTLLELFNTILEEHINAREGTLRKVKSEKDNLYQRIGLIERMSTPPVCNGLLNIIQVLWNDDLKNNLLVLLMELTKSMKQYCLEVLKGKNKAIEIFEILFKFIMNPENEDIFQNNVNVTALREVIEGFLNELKIRDEF